MIRAGSGDAIPRERAQVSTLLDRLEEVPERLIVVTGPRQTGKTTLVRQALGRAGLPHRYLPVDEPEPVTPPPFPLDREDTFALSNGATIPIAGEKDARSNATSSRCSGWTSPPC